MRQNNEERERKARRERKRKEKEKRREKDARPSHKNTRRSGTDSEDDRSRSPRRDPEFIEGASHLEIQDQDKDIQIPDLVPHVQVPDISKSIHLPLSPPLIPPSGRGQRAKRPPARYREDYLPEGPAPLPPSNEMQSAEDPEPEPIAPQPHRFLQVANNIRLVLVEKYWTRMNTFGLSQLDYGHPSRIPDELVCMEDMVTTAAASEPLSLKNRKCGIRKAIWPYPNISSWRLGSWFWSQGNTKSRSGFKELINNVLLADDFSLEDIRDVAWDKINELLGQTHPTAPEGEGWLQTDVEIKVPTGIKKRASDHAQHRAGKTFTVPGLWCKCLPCLRRTQDGEHEDKNR
ncbi:hypothetical protein M422DRAFT_262270 [Sphaerobolus stellatus SS14]|uniref:Uncharacterized protein n=1 Tax=Sphaerobolus stellatus (strain SS14) TaxID=990650 RepID=A0A0C9V1F9_SPHS4|nr:hypothetical protein M422DRAFT_262270 [Sphaerobolus stellatus SS14]